ncbi:MAG: peptidylprolyl isomerase [Candidatus Omnitrophica bacterium]|nr:peptidylprolyl isomerase [Candidatus Omnitrophota bacterium]
MNKKILLNTFTLILTCCVLFSCAKKEDETMTENETIAVLETSQGTIELKLYPDRAPKAVENFVELINQNYYDGVIFHRVIKNFMIQGGDPTGTGRGGESIWGDVFENEVHPDLKFDRKGLLAMANRGPDTNGSQFFITTAAPIDHLNTGYTIFGEVINGYDVVEKIENTPTGPGDRPKQEQVIIDAYIK